MPRAIGDRKICSKCKQEKHISEFHNNKHNPDGKCWWCAVCGVAVSSRYAKTHPPTRDKQDEINERQRLRRANRSLEQLKRDSEMARGYKQKARRNATPEKIEKERIKKQLRWRALPIEIRRAIANKRNSRVTYEQRKIYDERWRAKHPNYARDYQRRKRTEDIGYRLLCRIRCRIRRALENNVKHFRSEELIGCSMPSLRMYLESKFDAGMSWENMSDWDVDHIIPCALFDLSKPEHQKACFHFSNMQPLWRKDNLRKNIEWIKARRYPGCSHKT